MKDFEGDHIDVEVLPYRLMASETQTICIQHKGVGDLIPLSSTQALQLARKLIKAVMDG